MERPAGSERPSPRRPARRRASPIPPERKALVAGAAADLAARDPSYIRRQLPLMWLLTSLYFRAEVRGLDGAYVDASWLLIDPADFTPTDLGAPFRVGGTYDLAVCLEVAEHLPARVAPALVRTLTEATRS